MQLASPRVHMAGSQDPNGCRTGFRVGYNAACHANWLQRAQNAAAMLQVGVTTLKKICRKYHILRWPYRKRFSQNKLVERVTRHISEAAQPAGQADMRARPSSSQVGPKPSVTASWHGLNCMLARAKSGALQSCRHRK